ncbi:MAG: CRISPR-associated endonuclease Cas2 [Bacteroidetes bacterium]|nr:CRISPR-associated endonuclease Cas2 [Bacteroidota bacterium]
MLVVCYDIQKTKIRTKVADVLSDSGFFRVQKSVFEGDRPAKTVNRMKADIKKLLGREDQVRYYTICNRCLLEVEINGKES